MRRTTLAAAVSLALCVALPARAGLFSDDEARNRVEQLRTQVNALSDKIDAAKNAQDTVQHAQFDAANQIEALKADIAKLRGQIEVLTYDLDTAQKRQKDFYVDLDNRLRKLEQSAEAHAGAAPNGQPAVTPDGSAGAAAAAQPPDPANEAKQYEAGLNLIRTGKFREAVQSFDDFIKKYPSSSYQPAANYWLASAHFQLREYNSASELYTLITTRYADDVKAPDAWLGIANCQVELGDMKAARKTLESVQKKYAGTPQADLATKRLARLK